MVDLEKQTTDTLQSPEESLTAELQLEGSSNDLDHNQFLGSDEVDSLGDGVPGYETTGVAEGDDEVEEQIEASMQPNPMNTP